MAQKSKRSAARTACCRTAADLLRPDFFKALCDGTRLQVLLRLVESPGPATVGQVACCCPVDVSVVSRHLAALRDAGIVAAERRGKEVFYSVRYDGVVQTLRGLADAIEACCPTPDQRPS